MGWTFVHKEPGQKLSDFFRKEFEWDNPETGYKLRVLDCATYLNAAYLALEQTHGGEREVFALVCELQYRPRDHFNFGYKDVEEMQGPIKANCPERILNLLTPTDNEWAKEWREACWENLRRTKQARAIKPGALVEFAKPVRFTDGCTRTVFKVREVRGQRVLVDSVGPWSVRDSKWPPEYVISRAILKSREWSLIPDAAQAVKRAAELYKAPA